MLVENVLTVVEGKFLIGLNVLPLIGPWGFASTVEADWDVCSCKVVWGGNVLEPVVVHLAHAVDRGNLTVEGGSHLGFSGEITLVGMSTAFNGVDETLGEVLKGFGGVVVCFSESDLWNEWFAIVASANLGFWVFSEIIMVEFLSLLIGKDFADFVGNILGGVV